MVRLCAEKGCTIETSFHKGKYKKFCSLPCQVSYHHRRERLKEQSDYRYRLRKNLHAAKTRASSRNLPFDLDIEYLVKLWEDNEGCCVLTGIPFDLRSNRIVTNQINPNTVSLDRIHPKLGYVKGNVRLITYHMNVALADFGIEQFDLLIRRYMELN